MTAPRYTAAKVRPREGATWILTFRHPLKLDPRGKAGRKMRRSAGTSDDRRAEELLEQLNALLADDSWFSADRQVDAAKQFDEIVVRAFYDELTAPTSRSQDVRETLIPMPAPDEGYSRVLLVGPTGVGKTSLLRQLIGSHPDRDRFPSTSASRTTISDIEVITAANASYEGAATFFSEWTVQTLVHECVADACALLWEDHPDSKVAERLLQHRDMRFRLSYVLGSWGQTAIAPTPEDDDGFGDSAPEMQADGEEVPAPEDIAFMQSALQGYIARIRTLAAQAREASEEPIGALTKEAREAAQDAFEERVQAQSDFDELVADIMDDLRRRFESLDSGLVRRPGGWPESWYFTTDDRETFIRTIRRLSSNWAPSFGALLTPLVDGIRIRGPFGPNFGGVDRKLVLLDGEGLGHAKDSGAGVPLHISARFAEADVIVIVDTAKAPMLDAPTALLRAVASSGHQDKLALAFTNFDLLKGQANLPTAADQRAHVMATVHQALASLREPVGAPVVRAMARDIESRSFMLGYLNKPITDKNPASAGELTRLLDHVDAVARAKSEPVQVQPVYELARLLFAIQGAVASFHGRWNGLLGLGGTPGVRRAHWAEIKALDRRVALRIDGYEYPPANLLPVADLVGRFAESITRYLDTPLRWEGKIPTEVEGEAALGLVQREVYKRLAPFAHQRLIEDGHKRWTEAYRMSGRGSTFDRARAIQGIYIQHLPIPGPALDLRSTELLRDIQTLVREAIEAAGGTLVGEALG